MTSEDQPERFRELCSMNPAERAAVVAKLKAMFPAPDPQDFAAIEEGILFQDVIKLLEESDSST